MANDRIAACTIVSKNYLPFARTLAESFRRHHPGAEFFVLLVDRPDGYFDPARENFRLVEIEQLGNIPNTPQMLFKYSVLELNTALKPFLLDHLFREHGIERLLYLDPDILVLRPLDEIYRLLADFNIVTTPHITAPIPATDKELPNEITFLQCGIYNLGFIGVARSEESLRFLRWWQERLWYYCVSDIKNGLFVDQKWVDFATALFDRVQVLRDPGYNAAYWNLQERDFRNEGEGIMVNGRPLCFFHFSGLTMDNLDEISKYQTRFRLSSFPVLQPLFRKYHELLMNNGYADCRAWPYAFGTYDDGTPIESMDRYLYWKMGESAARFGDPFTTGKGSFYLHMLTKKQRAEEGGQFIESVIRFGLRQKKLIDSVPVVNKAARRLYRKLSMLKSSGEVEQSELKAHDDYPHRGNIGAVITQGNRGINLAGYLDTESGVGESARCLIRAIRKAGLPLALNNIEQNWMRRDDKTYAPEFVTDNPYLVNLLHVNADQTVPVSMQLGQPYFDAKYTIGYWYWEAPVFPADQWGESFARLHEVWTASAFCHETIAQASPVPVVKIPPPVRVDLVRQYRKEDFGLDPDSFAFLYVFDFFSFIERKNPFAVIEAFRRCVKDAKMAGAQMVIKCSNSDQKPDEYRRLLDAVRGLPVTIINRYLSKEDLHGLISVTDCYVALHRAEGFGLPIAEAMYLGKPVIVTGYSGNMEFTNSMNSYLVDYRLVEITESIGPYRKGYWWAEPDVEHAASQIARVFQDRGVSSKKGAAAAEHIRKHFSAEAIAKLISQRLSAIDLTKL